MAVQGVGYRYKFSTIRYESSCTCVYFFKNRSCKPVVGMKIRLKLETVPEAAKCIPLGQKRERWAEYDETGAHCTVMILESLIIIFV